MSNENPRPASLKNLWLGFYLKSKTKLKRIKFNFPKDCDFSICIHATSLAGHKDFRKIIVIIV